MAGKDKQQNTNHDLPATLTLNDYMTAFGHLSEKTAKELIPYNPQRHKDEARATIAKIFAWGFFILVGAILVGAPIYNLFVEAERALDVKDLLNAVSGVIGVPFGFVVGYYFKGSEEQ